MEMEYRRLGRSGLKVSVLSFGSWVTFGPQLDEGLAADCLAAAYDAGVNFFDNAEAYSAGESERIMGEAIAAARLAPPQLRASPPSCSGASTTSVNMQQHAQPQVPARRPSTDRSSASASTSSTCLLPPGRPGDAHRGDGVGHVRHHRARQGPLLGHVGVVGRRDPRRLGHRRAPPPAQAGGGAAAVQPA